MKYLPLALLTLVLASSCSQHTQVPPVRDRSAMVILNAPTTASILNYEQEALRLTNQFRRQHGLKPLRHNAALSQAARKHSAVMAKYGYVGHHEPNGPDSLLTRAKKAGYKPRRVLENVYGPNMQMSAIDHSQLTPSQVVRGWLESPGHRENLLSPNVEEVGHGHVDGFWTQFFGSPARAQQERPSLPRPKRVGPVKKPAPEPFNWRNL